MHKVFLSLTTVAGWRATTMRRGPGRRTPIRRMKEIDEVLKGADAYDGAGVTDPYYQHPDTLPQLHEWTAETFEADLEAGGHAAWPVLTQAFVFVRRAPASARAVAAANGDHLFWARASEIRAGAGEAYVQASQLLYDDDGDVAGSLVTIAGGDEASARALADTDPSARAFGPAEGYHWTVAQDPYLQLDVWPAGHVPYVSLRLDDAEGTKGRGGAREQHLSFLKKTRRTLRAGPLRPLDNSGELADRGPCGSLVYSFHSSREALEAWAAADPYVGAGVFTAPPLVAAPFVDLDVTGRQATRPTPLNELPDPLLGSLVDAGLVELPVRVVDRIDRNPETGKYERYNMTTLDPRLESNVNIDDEFFSERASTPKAIRAKRKRDKKRAEDEEFEAEQGSGDEFGEPDF